jgi:hypothetical protein
MRHTESEGFAAPCGNAARIDTVLQQTRRKRCRYDLVSKIAYLCTLAEWRYACLELYGVLWKDAWMLFSETSCFVLENWRETVAYPGNLFGVGGFNNFG